MSNANEEIVGRRVRLVRMCDPFPVDPGTEGTVTSVDDIGNIHVAWDDGRTLSIIPEVDEYELI